MHYQREQFFDSLEKFNSFPHGWDTDFSTVSSGPHAAALKQSAVPGLLVNTAWLGARTLQQASAPHGMRTFALPLHLYDPCCWRGLAVNGNTLMVFPSDRELFSMIGADAEILTLSIDQHLVDGCLSGWDLEPVDLFRHPRTRELSRQHYDRLRRNLGVITEFMVKYGEHRQFPQLSRGVQEYLVEQLLEPLTETITGASDSDPRAARRVGAASDYILGHLGEPLTVQAVCEAIGCSRRSLEQGFRKFIGTSPKQFIQFVRYRHCRAALLAAAPGSQVSQIAGRHGFWHMGEFSRGYRRLFGETPSQTLGRAGGPSPTRVSQVPTIASASTAPGRP